MNAPANLSRTRGVRQATQPRRGLSREEAAVYMGISPTKFDEGVAAGLLPKPRTGGIWGARTVWDIRALDSAWDARPDAADAPGRNPWDGRDG